MSEELATPYLGPWQSRIFCDFPNFNEAYEIAQQIFKYDPKTIKLGAKSDLRATCCRPDPAISSNRKTIFNHVNPGSVSSEGLLLKRLPKGMCYG